MNCAEIRFLLHAYVDDELDLARSLEIGQHLKSCARCAAETKSIQSLRDALQQNNLACRAPDSLRKNIRKMVRASVEGNRSRENPWLWKLMAAGATALAVLTILLRPAAIPEHDPLLKEAVASHIRSLQAGHLTDVASSDQHTVKPWFDGKLDFAPEVNDFAAQGFPLVGGRLDYLDGRTVAALVYHHKKHLINVFVWPVTKAMQSTAQSYHGYSVIDFDANGFHYCLVSDLNLTELKELARLIAS